MFISSVYIAEIPFLLPKIPLLPHLAYLGQLYFSLTKNIPVNKLLVLMKMNAYTALLTHIIYM